MMNLGWNLKELFSIQQYMIKRIKAYTMFYSNSQSDPKKVSILVSGYPSRSGNHPDSSDLNYSVTHGCFCEKAEF